MSRVFHRASPGRRTGFRQAAALACLVIGLPLAGCSFFQAQATTRGDPIDAETLQQLTPGTSTTADATALLGSPTAYETFDDDSWVYISQITRPQVGRLPAVLTQHVVVLNFDTNGVLRSVKVYDKADGKNVSMAPGTTATPGTSVSVLQQLFGTVGRCGGLSAGSPGL
jgi:outer membrane protein assembly factor BamE (lipoprotein component of BamABCDE complex)